MSDDTFLTIVRIAQVMAYTITFLIAAVVVFFTFRQSEIKAWFDKVGILAQIVAFIVLSTLLAQPMEIIIAKSFAFVIALIQSGDEFFASVQCFSGILIFAALAVGSWLLLKQTKK